MASNTERIHQLEDEIRQRDRRIAELKADLAKERDLSHRLTGHVGDCHNQIDSWKQAFDMVPDESGVWQWQQSFVEGDEWYEKYRDLLRKWNAFVPEYNAAIGQPRNVGRPLAASDAQCAQVRKLHKAGKSLRWIAEETSLGLNTVRTIVGKAEGTDRTTIKHLKRIDPDRAAMRSWKSKLQQRNALPKQIDTLRNDGDALLKEAKGLADRT